MYCVVGKTYDLMKNWRKQTKMTKLKQWRLNCNIPKVALGYKIKIEDATSTI